MSLAEAALLVALPQSPELRRPDRFRDAARAARNRVLDRVAATGVVPPDEIARARSQPVPHARKQLPMLAPHAADRIVSLEPDRRVHRLTIELPVQKTLQGLALERAQALGPDISVAILAVDNASGAVRARVASADYFDARRAGQVDMILGPALARFDLEAVYLWPRFRGWPHPPGNAGRRQAGALRQLHARKFRPDLPGHGHGQAGRCNCRSMFRQLRCSAKSASAA